MVGRKLSVIKVTVRNKIVDSVSNGILFFLKAKQSGLRPFPVSEKHEKCCGVQRVSTNNILLTVNLAVLIGYLLDWLNQLHEAGTSQVLAYLLEINSRQSTLYSFPNMYYG